MHPILRDYISGDKGGFFELIQAIAAHTDHGQGFPLRAVQPNRPEKDIRQSKARTRAKDVIQTRRGFVRFIF